jgi:uncharacterized membrane protein
MEAGASVITGVRPYKPGVFSSYGNGWRQMWKYFLELLLIGVIYVALSSVGYVFSLPAMGLNAPQVVAMVFVSNILSFAYSILFLSPVAYGVYFTYLRAARGDKLEVKEVFAAFKNYWNAVLASLLVIVIVVIGFILLIVPGIVFACKLAFVPYLVVDKKMDVITAVKTSWRMVSHGRAWKVFLIGLLAIPIVIAGLIVIGVGVIISIMWISMALASLYRAVDTAENVPVAEGPVYNP